MILSSMITVGIILIALCVVSCCVMAGRCDDHNDMLHREHIHKLNIMTLEEIERKCAKENLEAIIKDGLLVALVHCN